MATDSTQFCYLWQTESVRERLFEQLSRTDMCSVRLVNSACCNMVTSRLFTRAYLKFAANSFTKPSRIQALSRIGHHVEHLNFYFAHSEATFLPPLIHPVDGREIPFLYMPHTSVASALARPKYGSSELGDIMTQQFPPLFHAASNVPSFINALKHMPNMRHLSIKTPGQRAQERYRRDIVDYALISLRIAVERAPLLKLSKLSLSPVHPAAFTYLRHVPGFGPSPSASRRWRQIHSLNISVESWNFYGSCPGLDLLKIMDDFIRSMAPNLDRFSFNWLGRRGPCPLALSADPLFAPPRSTRKLFNEVTGPMAPLSARLSRQPFIMPRLRYMQVCNVTMNAPQVRALVSSHMSTMRAFDFENVVLIQGGTWDDALSPLSEDAGSNRSDSWSRRSFGVSDPRHRPEVGPELVAPPCASTFSRISLCFDQLDPPSPAPSQELFTVDLESMELIDVAEGVRALDGVEALEAGPEEPAIEDSSPTEIPNDFDKKLHESKVQVDGKGGGDDDDGDASDVEDLVSGFVEARQTSLLGGSKIRKQGILKRKSHKCRRRNGGHDDDDDGNENRAPPATPRTRHKPSGSDVNPAQSWHDVCTRPSPLQRPQSCRQKRCSEPSDLRVPFIPESKCLDDYGHFLPHPAEPHMNTSVPILDNEPLPDLLLPTVYDPSLRSAVASLHDTVSEGDGLSAVQQSIEAEMLAAAEEAAARKSALKRAKKIVLSKLSNEFSKHKPSHWQDSAAVVAARASSFILGSAHQQKRSMKCCGRGLGFRVQFGRSAATVAATTPIQSSMESQSALTSLMFSRS